MPIKEEFYLAQYQNWTSVLSRVKQSEQSWINTLLLIYGGLYFFQLLDFKEILIANEIEQDLKWPLLIGLLILNIVISLVWMHQSLNLRTEYYNAISEIQKIHIKLELPGYDHWLGTLKENKEETQFDIWYKVRTKPNRSKLIDFLLVSGLMFTSGLLYIIRYIKLDNNIEIIFSGIVLIALVLYPIGFYKISDKNRMKEIHSKFKDDDTVNSVLEAYRKIEEKNS